jgi:SAM-dependent methyltransferase
MLESALEPVNATLVELADLQPGQQVLDRASGFDEPAASAARRVGPAGSVIVADAQAHGLPEARFDAALWRFGLALVPDLASTLKRLAALLAPGGRLAAAVWGPPARCPALSIPWATMRQFTEPPSLPPGAAGLFGLGGEGVIDDELNFAGFTDVRSRRFSVVFAWESAEQFASFHQAVAVPLHGGAATVSSECREQMREALVGIARARAGPHGGLCLEAEVVVVVGRRPTQTVGGGPIREEQL